MPSGFGLIVMLLISTLILKMTVGISLPRASFLNSCRTELRSLAEPLDLDPRDDSQLARFLDRNGLKILDWRGPIAVVGPQKEASNSGYETGDVLDIIKASPKRGPLRLISANDRIMNSAHGLIFFVVESSTQKIRLVAVPPGGEADAYENVIPLAKTLWGLRYFDQVFLHFRRTANSQ